MIPEYIISNFETLQQADDAGHLAVVESHRIADGQVVYLLCAIAPPAEDDDDGTYNITPFAEMIDGNPYELYEPPHVEDEVGETSEDPDDASDSLGDPTEPSPDKSES